MELINHIISEMSSITLEEMSCVRLMNRLDSKYVMSKSTIEKLIDLACNSGYMIQEIDKNRVAQYHTVYYDTADLEMYSHHEIGRSVRTKIRQRTYHDTGDIFLEVKSKNNHGRTKKKRILINDLSIVREEISSFIKEKTEYDFSDLYPSLEVSFSRITLVNRNRTERVTIDLGLRYRNPRNNKQVECGNIVVLELKRDGRIESQMKDLLQSLRVRQIGFSKYCIGCALTNPLLRQNNIKEKIRVIKKIK